MKREELLHRRYMLLNHLSRLPRKMLLLQGNEHVTEFVLHELCGKECFNLEKAAYFVDNPDFDCLKGIAGFSRSEAYGSDDIWKDPQLFTVHMKDASFNQKVRHFSRESFRKKGDSEELIVQTVANHLSFKHHGYYCWDMKYDNHGLFVYERACTDDTCTDEHLLDGLSLLSFCPIV